MAPFTDTPRSTPWWLRLWTWSAPRRAYLLAGLVIALMVFNVDRNPGAQEDSSGSTREPWGQFVQAELYRYLFEWFPGNAASGPSSAWVASGALILGVYLSGARLRDAGVSPRWSMLFLVPGIRPLLGLILITLPTRSTELDATSASIDSPTPLPRPAWAWLSRWMPRTHWGCALSCSTAAAVVGVVLVQLNTEILGTYGWTLFLATPYLIGFFATWLYSLQRPLKRGDAMQIASLTVMASGLLLLGLAIEGMICLIMAAPIALVLAALGAATAGALARVIAPRSESRMMCLAVAAIPMLCVIERGRPAPPPVYTFSTEVFIAAPPKRVWPRIVDVTTLAPDQNFWSRLNLATFRRAWTEGRGLGATRVCEFNTGLARETVTAWEPPYRLGLRVETTPIPMEEWTFYKHIHPRHLEGYYQVNHASFELTAVEGGTLVRGTTEFQHGLWPADYWAWWCRPVIHSLQRHVLNAVKARTEAASGTGTEGGSR